MKAKALILTVASLLVTGCASTPPSATASTEVRLVDQRQIRNITGESRSLDAFSPKSSLIFGTHEKFYCLLVQTNLSQPATVELSADITDASGSSISTLLFRSDLRSYWQKYEGGFEERYASLLSTIDRYAMPKETRDWRSGNVQYFAVLSIPADAKPSKISAQLFINGVVEAQLELDLPPAAK